MVFSSTFFLFAFLPIVLGVYFVLRGVRARNAWLLASSLAFYAWGEIAYVAVLLFSIVLNWAFGLLIAKVRGKSGARAILSLAVAANLGLLGFFKYANFLVDTISPAFEWIGLAPPTLAPIHLPIGISFFTFQAITYVVDIYRRDAGEQRDPFRVALYIALFPQLIAGPIVRYRQVAARLSERVTHWSDAAYGTRRFIVGLAKKTLVANTLAVPADAIFALPPADMEPAVAWLGLAAYTGQIYFDFSGYSDMAIGLGRIFGFEFPENFSDPYSARSLRDFWRRWHISLSTWFRDYVYVPLGGNRRGALRVHVNLLSVFLLCGLWHGASFNFVVWGLLHGAFLSLERTRFGDWVGAWPRVLQGAYTLAVVMLAWVFFRADDLSHALLYLGALLGAGSDALEANPLVFHLTPKVAWCLVVALLLSIPIIRDWRDRLMRPLPVSAFESLRLAGLLALFTLCAMSLAAGTHNPFIYFRF